MSLSLTLSHLLAMIISEAPAAIISSMILDSCLVTPSLISMIKRAIVLSILFSMIYGFFAVSAEAKILYVNGST